MIKIVASYGLKVPAEQEYSSQSFHATAEIELADSLVNKPDALKAALHSLWGDLKAAVAEEIGRNRLPARNGGNGEVRRNGGNGQHREPVNRIAANGATASKKQIGFLLSLARRKRNFSAEQYRNWLRSERGLSLDDLSKQQAGQLIDELNGVQA
ncbi:MAG: hypothetical protein IPK87_00720 [Planctomycetes bacterium]|nr:hypothetical protein [Planctomycetota bacterium]